MENECDKVSLVTFLRPDVPQIVSLIGAQRPMMTESSLSRQNLFEQIRTTTRYPLVPLFKHYKSKFVIESFFLIVL